MDLAAARQRRQAGGSCRSRYCPSTTRGGQRQVETIYSYTELRRQACFFETVVSVALPRTLCESRLVSFATRFVVGLAP